MDFSGISLTDRTRHVFELAKEEVIRLKHEYFGAEHILLGLLDMSDGAACRAFDSVGVDRDAVRSQVEAMYPVGNASTERREVPYDQTGIAVLQNMAAEARRLGVTQISTGYLLLASLLSPQEPSYRALQNAGVNVPDVVKAIQADANDDDAGA